MRHVLQKGGRAQVNRKGFAAHEFALDASFALPRHAKRFAHQAVCTVCAHQVWHTVRGGLGTTLCAQPHVYVLGLRLKGQHVVLKHQPHAGQGLRVPQQGGLYIFLRHAVRQLWGLPRALRATRHLRRLACRGQPQPRQFVAKDAREVGNVGGVIGRQAKLAHFVCKAQPSKQLHGARLRGVGLRVKGGAGLAVYHPRGHAPAAQLNGQG